MVVNSWGLMIQKMDKLTTARTKQIYQMKIVVTRDTQKKIQSSLLCVSKLPFDQRKYRFKVNSQQINAKYTIRKVKCHLV